MVSERFHMDWATVMVSSFGAIVVRCDGRGSGFQGTNLLHRVQKKLGVFEEQDQREAIKYVAQTAVGVGHVPGQWLELMFSGLPTASRYYLQTLP